MGGTAVRIVIVANQLICYKRLHKRRNDPMKRALMIGLLLLSGCGDGNQNPYTDSFLARSTKIAYELGKPTTPASSDASNTTHHVPFFEDAIGVSSISTAYRITHNPLYLNAIRNWANRMITYQEQMIPSGAYVNNYSFTRKPGESVGDWYVADSSTIAQAIVRTSQLVDRDT